MGADSSKSQAEDPPMRVFVEAPTSPAIEITPECLAQIRSGQPAQPQKEVGGDKRTQPGSKPKLRLTGPDKSRSAAASETRPKASLSDEDLAKLAAPLDQKYAVWFKEMEQKNEAITRSVRDEYIKKAEEVYKRFAYVEAQPVCADAQMKVMHCYELNKNSSLNCMDEVKCFTECVRDHQLSYNRQNYAKSAQEVQNS